MYNLLQVFFPNICTIRQSTPSQVNCRTDGRRLANIIENEDGQEQSCECEELGLAPCSSPMAKNVAAAILDFRLSGWCRTRDTLG
jgi:hypothetical protein